MHRSRTTAAGNVASTGISVGDRRTFRPRDYLGAPSSTTVL
ncbi:MAG TPA: hypothetical protein VD859_17495 [Nocardioides sp.]|nr:hypothetical protein [Nocardioides sp.]